jgi:hypothetical protein
MTQRGSAEKAGRRRFDNCYRPRSRSAEPPVGTLTIRAATALVEPHQAEQPRRQLQQ